MNPPSDEPKQDDVLLLMPPNYMDIVPNGTADEAGEYAEYDPAKLEEAAKALGMRKLTKERLKNYHQVGDALQKVGPLKIGRTILMRCNEAITENIEHINEMLAIYEGKEDNPEIAMLVSGLISKRANAYYELQKLGQLIIKSAGSHLDDKPAKKRAKSFPAGRPVVFAQHATVNGQNVSK